MPKKRNPDAERIYQKNFRIRFRARLVERLGGRCVDCNATDEEKHLEFSHVIPLTEEQSRHRSKIGNPARLYLYQKEIEEKLIVLRCHSCNTKMSNAEPKQGFLTLLYPKVDIPF